MPDTFVKANGLSLNINGVTNFTGSRFTVLLGQGNYIYKYTDDSGGTVNFSAGELSVFNVNEPISIQVNFNNHTSVVYGGITHGFTNSFTYTKKSYLK